MDAMYEERSGLTKRPHVKFSVPAPGEGKTRKKTKQTGVKRADPPPMVDLFNDATGTYDRLVFVRQVLKDNQIVMSLLDFMAWFPEGVFVRMYRFYHIGCASQQICGIFISSRLCSPYHSLYFT